MEDGQENPIVVKSKSGKQIVLKTIKKNFKENDVKHGFYSNERFDFDSAPNKALKKTKTLPKKNVQSKKKLIINEDLENDSLSEGYHFQSEKFVVKPWKTKTRVKTTFRSSSIHNDSSPEPKTAPNFSKKLLKSFDEKSDFQNARKTLQNVIS